jgi:hypothetical protein
MKFYVGITPAVLDQSARLNPFEHMEVHKLQRFDDPAMNL